MSAELHAEARALIASLGERGLDQSAVAFHLGVEHSTVHRWWHGTTKDLTHAVAVLRLLDALLRTCPEAARAARVYSAEEWADLMGGLRPTHRAAWSQQGAGVVRGEDYRPPKGAHL